MPSGPRVDRRRNSGTDRERLAVSMFVVKSGGPARKRSRHRYRLHRLSPSTRQKPVVACLSLSLRCGRAIGWVLLGRRQNASDLVA